MKISVKLKPNAKENRIEKIDRDQFSIRVKARPQKNRANQAAIEILADYFGVSKSGIKLLRGHATRHKLFEIK